MPSDRHKGLGPRVRKKLVPPGADIDGGRHVAQAPSLEQPSQPSNYRTALGLCVRKKPVPAGADIDGGRHVAQAPSLEQLDMPSNRRTGLGLPQLPPARTDPTVRVLDDCCHWLPAVPAALKLLSPRHFCSRLSVASNSSTPGTPSGSVAVPSSSSSRGSGGECGSRISGGNGPAPMTPPSTRIRPGRALRCTPLLLVVACCL